MSSKLTKDIEYKLYKHGQYYSPARKHYKNCTTVGCDKCLKKDISVCIGWEDYDICLKCMSEIEKRLDDCYTPDSDYDCGCNSDCDCSHCGSECNSDCDC